MKPKAFSFSTLALASLCLLQLVGCGGSSGAPTTSLTAGGSRDKVAQALKSAASSSADVKAQTGGASKSLKANSLRSLTPVSREGESEVVGNKTQNVGDVFDLGSGNFGVITAIEPGGPEVGNELAVFKYDIFRGAELTEKVGFSESLNTKTGSELRNYSLTEFTSGPNATEKSLSDFIFDESTGKLIKVAENRFKQVVDGTESFNYFKVSLERLSSTSEFVFDFTYSLNGFNRTSKGTYFPDGRIEQDWTGNSGYRVIWKQNADGTGTFTVLNTNDPLLPATGTFDAEGKGTITYSNGTSEQFDINSETFWNK